MKAPLLVCNTLFSAAFVKVQVPAGTQIWKIAEETGHIYSNNPQAAI